MWLSWCGKVIKRVRLDDKVYELSPIVSYIILRWHNGAVGRALDLQSTGSGFKSYSGQSCIITLGKLFTPMCLCHQAV